MPEKLTWDEIKRRYPDEWVAVVDYEWPDNSGVPVAGVVYAHSPDHAQLIEGGERETSCWRRRVVRIQAA